MAGNISAVTIGVVEASEPADCADLRLDFLPVSLCCFIEMLQKRHFDLMTKVSVIVTVQNASAWLGD